MTGTGTKSTDVSGGWALGEVRPKRPVAWTYLLALVAITGAAAVLRAVRLDHPMRYDESFSLLMFALPAKAAAWFNYSAPNNHLLHTLLVHLMTYTGSIAPPVIRAPAFLAGVALVPAAAEFARRASRREVAGLLAAGFVGASSLLVEYSANARGYSIICLATLLMGCCTVSILEDPRRRRAWVAFVIISAAGLCTIPVMLYPIGIFAAVIVLQSIWAPAAEGHRRVAIGRLLMSLAAAGVLTGVFYLPAVRISGPGAILANRFVTPRPLQEVIAHLPAAAGQTLADWTRDAPGLLLGLIILGLIASMVIGIRRRRVLWLVPAGGPVLLALAALIQRVVPFPRVWLFLLPVVLASAGVGLAELGGAAWTNTARRTWILLGSLLIAVAVGQSAWLMGRRTYLISEDPDTLVEARQIIQDAGRLADGRTAILWNWDVPNWPPLQYYALLDGKWGTGFVDYRHSDCSRALLIVDNAHSLEELYQSNPAAERLYHPPRPWRTYKQAKVYLARRDYAAPTR